MVQTSVLPRFTSNGVHATHRRATWRPLVLVALPIAHFDGYDRRYQSMRPASDGFKISNAVALASDEAPLRSTVCDAAGVAHDLRNLVQVVSSALRLIDRHLQPGVTPQLEQLLAGATNSIARMTALCQRLLVGSQAPRAPGEWFRPDVVLSQMRDILELAAGPTVVVHLNYGSSATVLCPRLEFECAILNLVVNSRDAMKGLGTLTVSTRDEPAIRSRSGSSHTGPVLCVAVHDTGPGMSADVAERAFRPFFTTKRGGTGVGLADVAGFVDRAGGTVLIASAPGEGTTITLRLPTSPS